MFSHWIVFKILGKLTGPWNIGHNVCYKYLEVKHRVILIHNPKVWCSYSLQGKITGPHNIGHSGLHLFWGILLSWWFTALRQFSGHFGRGLLTYPHCSWANLLGSLPLLGAHSFASNWQLPFLNQRKGENGRKNYFITNLHKQILPDLTIEHVLSKIVDHTGRMSRGSTVGCAVQLVFRRSRVRSSGPGTYLS